MRVVIGAAVAVFVSMSGAHAGGLIQKACLGTGGLKLKSVCSCMQTAADMTLTPSDQRRAASFFLNPSAAQAVSLSSNRKDRDFWGRYTLFTKASHEACIDDED